MDMQGVPGLAALVELPTLAAPVSIRASFSFLLRTLGVAKNTPRADLPHAIPASAAVSLLQLLSTNLPEDANVHDAAAALCPAGVYRYRPELQVQLDALLGLACLLSSGSKQDKLQLCFWTLDRDSSGSLDLQQVLGVIPAAQQASAAARVILQEVSLEDLSGEVADPQAAAERQQATAVLQEVLSRAFAEADPQGTGLIRPGEQLTQLLFAAAAQLTSIMVGAAPLSREGTAFGSSHASSASTTPPCSLSPSPFRQPHRTTSDRQPPPFQQQHHHHHQQQQQQQLVSSHQHHHHQQQQQQHRADRTTSSVSPGATPVLLSTANSCGTGADLGAAMADVVIMDGEGGVLHYQAPVDQAAAAACQGRVPLGGGSSGVMRAYGPSAGPHGRGGGLVSSRHSLGSAGGSLPQQQQGLAPASSLLQHLERLEAAQQQQQQQGAAGTGPGEEPSVFLTPNGTASAEEGAAAEHGDGGGRHTESPFVRHGQQEHQQQLHHQQQQQLREEGEAHHHPRTGVLSHLTLRPGTKSSPGSSTNNSLRRIFVGGPFVTISESVNARGTSSTAEQAGRKDTTDGDATADDGTPALPATAAGAITHTATNVMATIQSNVIAVVVKLLLHCGMCFLIILMVALGNAAIITGLHLGAKLPLSASFGVAVAANLVLVLVLLGGLVAARLLNAANNDRLAQVANSPEAQQLDQILETMKAAVQALKNTEQQQQQQNGLAVGAAGGSTSNRFTGSHFLGSRASSLRDVEQGRPGGAAGALGRAPSGPLAVAGKFRAVWSAVGRVAGFLPPAQDTIGSDSVIAGPFGSAVALEGGVVGPGQHSSTSWGASSGPEGVGAAAPQLQLGTAAPGGGARAERGGAGGGQPARPVSPPQARQQRVAGAAAPQTSPGASPVAPREAYPQL